MLTAIGNTRRGSGESREEEVTAIRWTLWGKQVEHAEYLGKDSHVNIVGRLHNNNCEQDNDTIYLLAFTAEEIDYFDSRAESEARRSAGKGSDGSPDGHAASTERAAAQRTNRKPCNTRQPALADA